MLNPKYIAEEDITTQPNTDSVSALRQSSEEDGWTVDVEEEDQTTDV